MKFMVRYTITDQDKRLPLIKKWGAMTPQERANEPGEGITKLGSWHDLAGRQGVAIIESNDLTAVGRWVGRWSPYLDADILPVVDDEESAVICHQIVADHNA